VKFSPRALSAALGFVLLLPVCSWAAPPRHVLIMYGNAPDLPGARILSDAIQTSLRQTSGLAVEFYVESIDTGRLPLATSYEQRLAALLEEKYRDTPIDLVVALSEPAVQFVVRERALFPGAALLLGLIDHRFIDAGALPANATPVYVQVDVASTIRAALQNHPGARRVYVVGGGSRFDRGWESIAREDLRDLEPIVAVTYDTDSTFEALLQHVAALPPDAIVLYTAMTRDADGDPARPVDVLEAMRRVSRVPIYGISSTNIGHGIVGGSLLDFDGHGTDMAAQAVRILRGERPAPLTTPAVTRFDWPELQRFNVAVESLPSWATVENRPLSLWQRDKYGLLVGGSVFLAQAGLIFALIQIALRRREAQRLLESRLAFDTLLMDLTLSLTATPADQIDAAIEADVNRITPKLGIERVFRWHFDGADDKGWDSPALRTGQPALFGTIAELPPSLQSVQVTAGSPLDASAVAVPLVSEGTSFGALFYVSHGRAESWTARPEELHMIATAVANVLQRKQADRALGDSLRLKNAILESLPAQVAVLDREGTIIAVNDAWMEFGRCNGAPETAIGPGVSYLQACRPAAGTDPEAARAMTLIDAVCRGEQEGSAFEYSSEVGGRRRWFLMNAVPLRREQKGAVVTHTDISVRKLNEVALRESEDRFRRMADALPVAIWMSENDGSCSYLNQGWLQLTGRSLEQDLGVGWLENIHPDDRPSCMETYTHAFEGRRPFSMEYRVRRHDGEYRWLLDSGMPRYGGDGAFHGFLGGCVDITERREAEHMLRDLNRRLLAAQEEERRHIARELHDHLSQQLALLAIDLQELATKATKPADRAGLQAAWRRTAEIASDVHGISHRLHPSKMEALGLVATIRGHCVDVSRKNLAVEFRERDVPPRLPPDTSMCLFRVAEEALTNVARHSGAARALVTLDAGAEIVLKVTDSGRGFPCDGSRAAGLGLVSMRERLEALGGTLTITSGPGKGTTVEARVPRPQASRDARVAESA
jgi:PAS domain S-box-containing protein